MSKLLQSPSIKNRISIGDYQLDVAADQAARGYLVKRLPDIEVVSAVGGRKMVPVQYVAGLYSSMDKRINDLKASLENEKKFLDEKFSRDIRSIREEYYKKGFSEGYSKGGEEGRKAGLDEGLREAGEIVAKFTTLMEDAVKQREVLINEAHRKIIDLVMAITRKITFDAARADPEITAVIIENVIAGLTDRSKLKVKVNPDDLAFIEKQVRRFKDDKSSMEELAIEGDPIVRAGGCYIETPSGDIDARLETQIDVIRDNLTDDG